MPPNGIKFEAKTWWKDRFRWFFTARKCSKVSSYEILTRILTIVVCTLAELLENFWDIYWCLLQPQVGRFNWFLWVIISIRLLLFSPSSFSLSTLALSLTFENTLCRGSMMVINEGWNFQGLKNIVKEILKTS